MTDNARGHADIEALSAYVDGEAPEWADHVTGCATCRASADELRAVAAAVGVPVGPSPAGRRDAAVAAALDDVGRRHTAERARFDRRRPEWRWAVPAVAAMVAGVLGFSTLVARDRGESERTTAAGRAPESVGDASADGSESSALASQPPGDLGDVPDAATLLARARPALAATAGRSSAGALAAAPSTSTSLSLNARLPAPAIVGTRVCEEQARARQPGLREVVYFATARRGAVPAVVLGFATGPAPAPVTLLLLAQEGCAELLRAAGP